MSENAREDFAANAIRNELELGMLRSRMPTPVGMSPAYHQPYLDHHTAGQMAPHVCGFCNSATHAVECATRDIVPSAAPFYDWNRGAHLYVPPLNGLYPIGIFPAEPEAMRHGAVAGNAPSPPKEGEGGGGGDDQALVVPPLPPRSTTKRGRPPTAGGKHPGYKTMVVKAVREMTQTTTGQSSPTTHVTFDQVCDYLYREWAIYPNARKFINKALNEHIKQKRLLAGPGLLYRLNPDGPKKGRPRLAENKNRKPSPNLQ